jgi:FAD/FMN-containing dehydrogenase
MQQTNRESSAYDAARSATVWNALRPDRFPDVIVQAESVDDVIAAVRQAREAGRQVTVRSGGHSWSGHHLRDGVTLIDLSKMNSIVSIDPEAQTVIVEPGAHGTDLIEALDVYDLFFPIGHCPGVGIGGFLLQGGFGWNSRAVGPACMSIEAIDVVTANGELVRADADNNPELLWAARGSGPGFFGVVTRFHLKAHPKPKVCLNAVNLYPIELMDEVFTWLRDVSPRVPVQVEMNVITHYAFDGNGLEIAIGAPTLAASEEEALNALTFLEECPVFDQAKAAIGGMPAKIEDMLAIVHYQYPDNHRYSVDNMWTHSAASELLPGLKRAVETIPEHRASHMLWLNWAPSHPDTPQRPDMAFSVEDEIYIAAYGVWDDARDDEANIPWATETMGNMEPYSTGIQLADENLTRRAGRFMTDDNHERYDRIREHWDPERRFISWEPRS